MSTHRSIYARTAPLLVLALLPTGVAGQSADIAGLVQEVVGDWAYEPASGGEPTELVEGAFVEVGSVLRVRSDSGEVRLLLRDRSERTFTCPSRVDCEGGRRVEGVEGAGPFVRLMKAVARVFDRDALAGAPSETRSVGAGLLDGVLTVGDRGVSGLDRVMAAVPRGRYHLRLEPLDGSAPPEHLGTCDQVFRWPGATSSLSAPADWPLGPSTLSLAVADGSGCPGEGWRDSAVVLVVPPGDPAVGGFDEVVRELSVVEDDDARRRLLRAYLLTSGGDG